jgi:hypothetical protein
MVGLYEMSEANTPDVGPALGELSAIPEAHCYLMFEGRRFDFTGLTGGVASPFDSLIEERVFSEWDLLLLSTLTGQRLSDYPGNKG